MDYSKINDDAIAASKAATPESNRFIHQSAGAKAVREAMEADVFDVSKPNQATLDAVWRKAWEDGQAYGFHEVYQHYDDIADIVKLAMAG